MPQGEPKRQVRKAEPGRAYDERGNVRPADGRWTKPKAGRRTRKTEGE